MLLPLIANATDMVGVQYVAIYNSVTGYIIGLWAFSETENTATAVADGELILDGTQVASFQDGIPKGLFIVLSAPSYRDTSAGPGVYEVDDPATPTDVAERSDGDRDPYYPFGL